MVDVDWVLLSDPQLIFAWCCSRAASHLLNLDRDAEWRLLPDPMNLGQLQRQKGLLSQPKIVRFVPAERSLFGKFWRKLLSEDSPTVTELSLDGGGCCPTLRIHHLGTFSKLFLLTTDHHPHTASVQCCTQSSPARKGLPALWSRLDSFQR